jgi:hypothetical protein
MIFHSLIRRRRHGLRRRGDKISRCFPSSSSSGSDAERRSFPKRWRLQRGSRRVILWIGVSRRSTHKNRWRLWTILLALIVGRCCFIYSGKLGLWNWSLRWLVFFEWLFWNRGCFLVIDYMVLQRVLLWKGSSWGNNNVFNGGWMDVLIQLAKTK